MTLRSKYKESGRNGTGKFVFLGLASFFGGHRCYYSLDDFYLVYFNEDGCVSVV